VPPTCLKVEASSTRSKRDLRGGAHLADLVEEDRAAGCHLEEARLGAIGAVKAPRSWPNSSLWQQALLERGATPPSRTGAPAAALRAWISFAAISLPAPVSPVMSTVEFAWATRSSSRSTPRNSALSPMNALPRSGGVNPRSRSSARSFSACRSRARWMRISSSSSGQGFDT